MAHLQHLLLVVEALLLLFHVLATAADLLLTLVEVELALLQSVLTLLDALVALLHLLLQLALLVEEFLLHLQELLLLHYLGVLARLVHHLLILSLENISENSISDAASDCQSHDCNDYFYHVLMLFFFYHTLSGITSSISCVSLAISSMKGCVSLSAASLLERSARSSMAMYMTSLWVFLP